MDDITFFEDYQYQLRLNNLDRNLMELDRLSMEVTNGLLAIHNATVVEQYQDKYGYTEHFQMLIGEEGLFDTAKEALANIIRWLKKKLLQLASLIFNIVNEIARVIASIVWMIVNFKKMTSTKSPYNIGDVAKTYLVIYDDTARGTLLDAPESIQSIGDLSSAVNEVLDRSYRLLEERVDTESKQETSYEREKFLKLARGYELILNDKYITTLNTMGKVIDTLQKSLNENDTFERVRDKIGDFIRRFPGAQYFLAQLAKSKLLNSVDLDASNGWTTLLRTQASVCILFATAYSKFYNKCIRKGVQILKELHAAYNKGEVTIHMEFPFDQQMIKRLSDFYGAPIKATKIVVTNASPSTWSLAKESDGLMGWCYMGSGSGVSYPTELWINVRVLTSWMARFSVAFVNDARVNKYDYFLGVVVHECKHLWDMQYGKEFDVIREGDSFFKYRRYKHERRAQEAATKFEITDRDRAWAKRIIDQVEAEIKKQKQK